MGSSLSQNKLTNSQNWGPHYLEVHKLISATPIEINIEIDIRSLTPGHVLENKKIVGSLTEIPIPGKFNLRINLNTQWYPSSQQRL